MRKVKVITDSTADLPKEVLEARGIEAVPVRIIFGDKSFPDDGSLSANELFEFADKTGSMPKAVPVSERYFEERFKKWLDEDYDIIYTGISRKLSENVQHAVAAAVTVTAAMKLGRERISVVDSMSLSCGIALLVLEAADMADSGAGLAEITERVIALRVKKHGSFVIETLKYFYMGGWCSKFTSAVSSGLNIKPMIVMKSGEIVPGAAFMGKDYIDKYCRHVMKEADRIDPKRIFIAHCLTDCAEEIRERLKDYGFNNVIVADTSLAISGQVGPGTLGIFFLYK